jgi:hypothetical protein
MNICGKAMHLRLARPPIRTGANCNFQTNQLELPEANGMRTLDIPVYGISRKIGRQLDWLAVNCLDSISYVRALMQ